MASSTFDFGPYNLDPAKRLLLRSGEPVPLPPKAFDTLVILVERHERVVSKDELLRTIWPDTVVEEASLSQQIFLLRKTLNSGSEEAEYIATIARRGYRFVGPIAHVVSSAPAANGSSRRVAWAAGVAMAVGFAALGVGVLVWPRSSPTLPVTRLSVLPPAGTLSWGSPVLSPDGRSLAFRAQIRDGRDLLWIRRFDSPAAAALQGTEEADFPFWSPDGRWLAFFARGKLKKIRADGGLVQVLCDAPWGRGGAWSRDDVIVFAPEPRSALYRVPAGGGVPTPVTSLAKSPNERSHRFPHFFGDGRHFVYSSLRNDSPRALVIGSIDSPDRHEVLTGEARSGEAYAPSPFMVFRREGRIIAQTFDLSRFQFVGGTRTLVDYVPEADATSHENFSTSENGVLAYLGGTQRTSELIWYDRAGRRIGAMGPPGHYLQLSLSRDESRAAVVRVDPATRQREIWVIDAHHGSIARVTAGPPNVDDPAWSPDGRRIAFVRQTVSTLGEVHITDWRGAVGAETVLPSSGNNFVYDWSPDAQFVLIAREEDPVPVTNLWTVAASGERAAAPFLKTAFHKTAARFSPDGRWVAYTSDESGRTDVYVTSFPKADFRRQISTDGGEKPEWRRDGRELFFVSTDGRLMASDVSREDALTIGSPHPLFVLPASTSGQPDPWRWAYAVAGHGERFLINTPRDEGQLPINVVLNWTSLLTER